MEEYERNTQQLIESNKRYYDSPEEIEWLKQRLFVNPSDSVLGSGLSSARYWQACTPNGTYWSLSIRMEAIRGR